MVELGRLRWRGAPVYETFVLFAALASTFWVSVAGIAGAATVAGTLTVVSILLSLRRKRSITWVAGMYSLSIRAQLALLVLAVGSLMWSSWPWATVTSLILLIASTIQGLFLGRFLEFPSLTQAVDHALRWVVGLSLLLEVWVAAVVRGPMPTLFMGPHGVVASAETVWIRGNLFDGGRIQGIVGNANTLGILCALSIVVIIQRALARRRADWSSILFAVSAACILIRTGSVTSMVALFAALAAVVASAVFVLPRSRLRTIVGLTLIGAGLSVTAAAVMFRDAVFSIVGRGPALTGRVQIWEQVWERAASRPLFGHGYASPWNPMDPAFAEWIIDHDQVVIQAHNMWLDIFLQLGIVGTVIAAAIYLSFWVSSWRFATSSPRVGFFLASIPLYTATLILVQGLVESSPLNSWGWMLVTAFAITMGRAASPGKRRSSAPTAAGALLTPPASPSLAPDDSTGSNSIT